MCNTCSTPPNVVATAENMTAQLMGWGAWRVSTAPPSGTYGRSRPQIAWREQPLMLGQLNIASIYEYNPPEGCRYFTVGHWKRPPYPTKYCCYADALAALKELLP